VLSRCQYLDYGCLQKCLIHTSHCSTTVHSSVYWNSGYLLRGHLCHAFTLPQSLDLRRLSYKTWYISMKSFLFDDLLIQLGELCHSKHPSPLLILICLSSCRPPTATSPCSHWCL